VLGVRWRSAGGRCRGGCTAQPRRPQRRRPDAPVRDAEGS
jgi:hypothetical protein